MKRFLVILTVLSLVLPVLLTACGGSGEEESITLSPTATPITTITGAPTATPSPTSTGPVKIGAISAWSGAAAMSGTYFGRSGHKGRGVAGETAGWHSGWQAGRSC